VLRERLDPQSVEWLLETIPFDRALRRRLQRAASRAARRETLQQIS
jgi:hypothetical protein